MAPPSPGAYVTGVFLVRTERHHVCGAVDDSFGEKVLVMKRTSAKTKSSRQKTAVQDRGLYTVEVCLVGGPGHWFSLMGTAKFRGFVGKLG